MKIILITLFLSSLFCSNGIADANHDTKQSVRWITVTTTVDTGTSNELTTTKNSYLGLVVLVVLGMFLGAFEAGVFTLKNSVVYTCAVIAFVSFYYHWTTATILLSAMVIGYCLLTLYEHMNQKPKIVRA